MLLSAQEKTRHWPRSRMHLWLSQSKLFRHAPLLSFTYHHRLPCHYPYKQCMQARDGIGGGSSRDSAVQRLAAYLSDNIPNAFVISGRYS